MHGEVVVELQEQVLAVGIGAGQRALRHPAGSVGEAPLRTVDDDALAGHGPTQPPCLAVDVPSGVAALISRIFTFWPHTSISCVLSQEKANKSFFFIPVVFFCL